MAIFPAALASLPRPTAQTKRNAPGFEGHALHNQLADEIEAIEGVIGVTGSAVTDTLDYKVRVALPASIAEAQSAAQSAAIAGAPVQSVSGRTGAVTLTVADVSGAASISNVGLAADAGKRAAVALIAALSDQSQSVAIQVLGDSTGNDTGEWPRLIANQLASDNPAWTVRTILFSDTTQKYSSPVVIQTGPDGERYFDGATGTSTRTLAASESPYISGTIDVSVKMRLASWSNPGAQVNVFGKSGSPGYRGWYGYLNSTGIVYFAYSTDGTALVTMAATNTGITDNTDYWVRWIFTPDDGAGNRVFRAYKSPDGETWTQIGSTVTTSGAVSVYNNSTIGYEVGGVSISAVVRVTRLYEIIIRDGEDGKIVAPVMPDLWYPKSSSSAYFTGSPTLTVVNGSVSGAGITGAGNYLADATRLPKLTPNYGQVLCFLSTSHNDGYDHGRSYRATYGAWIDSVKELLPDVPICLLTQNPEKSGATWYREHAKRHIDLLTMEMNKSVVALDTYQDFIDYQNWQTDYMADNVHPNSAGQAVLANRVMAFINGAKLSK